MNEVVLLKLVEKNEMHQFDKDVQHTVKVQTQKGILGRY